MQTLTAQGLSKAYGDKQLFNQIDFLINEGERIGLIGVNGTGKRRYPVFSRDEIG